MSALSSGGDDRAGDDDSDRDPTRPQPARERARRAGSLAPEQLARIQAALQQQKLDAGSSTISAARTRSPTRVLGLDPRGIRTRRWYCFVPRTGSRRSWCTRSSRTR